LTYDASGKLINGEVSLEGVCEIEYKAHTDDRGFMLRLLDHDLDVVQESISFTEVEGTLRGLSVQSEAKVITCLQGVTQWVVVDLRNGRRQGIDTFGKWKSFELTKYKTLLVETGFAHGCLSLTDNCELLIRSNQPYHPITGIHWKDKDLAIEWKNPPRIVSARDESYYQSFAHFKLNHGGL
jgi:dTDP-4-dehydrorhamnose 3,5-epimerase